jgi:hypothetical protein
VGYAQPIHTPIWTLSLIAGESDSLGREESQEFYFPFSGSRHYRQQTLAPLQDLSLFPETMRRVPRHQSKNGERVV